MDNNQQTHSEPGVATLLNGIVNDTQELLKQQLALFREEVEENLHKTRDAGIFLLMGAGVLMVGAIILGLALVQLLQHAVPTLPVWASYALVGSAVAIVGGGLIYQAKIQFASFSAVPEKTTQALKENLEWKTTPR